METSPISVGIVPSPELLMLAPLPTKDYMDLGWELMSNNLTYHVRVEPSVHWLFGLVV